MYLLPNLRHLKCFYEVGVEQGIGRAAQKVHLSQPAVTQAVAGLEKRLGQPLFDRVPDAMLLTEPGKILHLRVGRLLHLLANGARDVGRIAGRNGERANPGFQAHLTASQLRALLALSQAGNFSQAAREIGISQPSLHRAARDFEALSGVILFRTSRQGTDLTRAGTAMARAVSLAATEYQQALAELAALDGADNTCIRIGSLPLSRSAILPNAIDALVSDGNPIQVVATDGPYPDLLRALRFGELDALIGALRSPCPGEDLVQEHLFSDTLVLVAGPNHPLLGRKDLSLNDLRDYPWIAPPKATPAGSYLMRFLGLDQIDQTPVRVVSSSLIMVRGLLARGPYLSIISRSQISLEQSLNQIIPLDVPLPDSTRSIGLTTRRDWRPTPTQARFLTLIREAVKQEVDPLA